MEVRKKARLIRAITHTCFGLMIVSASALLVGSKLPTTLERVHALGELRVISRNGPTTYYEGPHGQTGFEYLLLKQFANELGVELVIEDEEALNTMLHKVRSGQTHFAAAGLSVTERRRRLVRFNTPYMTIRQQVLYNSRTKKPTSVQDLVGKEILVIANSSHAERLKNLQQHYPALSWREESAIEMIDLLEKVHSGEVDYAIVDSNAYSLNRHTFPRARVAFDLGAPQELAWAFPQSQDESLYRAAEDFLQRIKSDGTLAAISERFYDHIDEVTTGGALLFSYRLKNRLPQWQTLLKDAAQEFELDWRLLAAISYQESHWNPDARSRTGVRGLMMLTMAAASDMGINNRVDPAQSIHGGAKYFRNLYDRLPERIQGEDRTWLALAAYNVGMGHLEDARKITQALGGDPDRWVDVREHLPLLAKRSYYKYTRHGYARGWEPVTYVRNIRNFYSIIAWHEQQDEREIATQTAEADVPHARKVSHRALSMPLSVL
ncbi:membrane-bound lytic murein transglycosylase MltF [Marinimicrobium agarilyticum]|uniref:membrane-bound lytic murein transglycosylase MltF n=1 Tax=Marinimicrobium agarilyticum TaxID=306546 RepID=UPI0003FB66C1|nr:membrane-bound lytic murein transglycosylase MltF [Marinimicrobium agarilyticum]